MSTSGSTSSRTALSAALLALTGCGLLAQGTSQEVTFTSQPPGAIFTVAGQSATTPATLIVPKDDYEIVFTKPGYHPTPVELKRQMTSWFFGSILLGVISTTLDLLTGAWQEFQTTKVHVILEPLPDTPLQLPLAVTSDPPGAEIRVDGVVHGKTPKDLQLVWIATEPQKSVEFELPGYFLKRMALPQQESRLHAVLDPRPTPVKVYITSKPKDAQVRVAGKPEGRTPTTVEVVWLPKMGPMPVELTLEGYHPARAELRGPGQTEVQVDLQEIVTELPLALKVTPSTATLEVDGTSLGAAPPKLTLRWSITTQRHTLRFSNPGYTARSIEITRDTAETQYRADKALEVHLAPALPKVP